MKKVDYKTYVSLLESKVVSESAIPKGVYQSSIFQGLLQAEILTKTKVGRGFKIQVAKENEYEEFFKTSFPVEEVEESKSGNIKKFRNSKALKIQQKPIFLFRGFTSIKVNDRSINLNDYTTRYGLYSAIPESLVANKICFVENLEAFLNAERLIGKDFVLIHKYGRIGQESISMMKAKKVIVFVDYDFNGLDEYLRIKRVFTNASLFIPENYDYLFDKFSVSLSKNKAKMTSTVKASHDAVVIKIRNQVARTNRFLEQEVLIDV